MGELSVLLASDPLIALKRLLRGMIGKEEGREERGREGRIFI
jgi:hypothetical protein